MVNDYLKNTGTYYASMFTFIALGTVVGALLYLNKYNNACDIKNYLDSFFCSVNNGVDSIEAVKGFITQWGIILLIIAVCGFIKAGIVGIVFIMGRQGFIYGFSNAALIGIYGLKGIYTLIARLPVLIITITILAIFGGVNAYRALKIDEKGKKDIIFLLFFLFVSITIFSITAFYEGYITTIFMKIIVNSVT